MMPRIVFLFSIFLQIEVMKFCLVHFCRHSMLLVKYSLKVYQPNFVLQFHDFRFYTQKITEIVITILCLVNSLITCGFLVFSIALMISSVIISFSTVCLPKIDEQETFEVFTNIETSISRVGILSASFSTINSVGSVCMRDEKSAAAFALQGISAKPMLKEELINKVPQ